MIDHSSMRSPAPLLSSDLATSSQPTTPEQPPAPPAPPADTEASTHFPGLRRRRPRARDLEGGDGSRAGDASVGVSTAVAPQRRTLLQQALGTGKYNPTTVTVTAFGYQPINRYTAGGPAGAMPKPTKFPALEADRFSFEVPASHAGQLEAVTQLLDTAKGFGKWLKNGATADADTAGAFASLQSMASSADTAFATTATRVDADTASAGSAGAFASLQSMASSVGTAFATTATTAARTLGLVSRPTPTLADMAPADASTASAAPSDLLRARVNEQKAFIEAAGAKYGARGVEIAADKAMRCLQAAAGDQDQALAEHFAKFKALSLARHGLPASAPAAEHIAHAQALENHRAAPPSLPPDVAASLDDTLRALDDAFGSEAAALARHEAAATQLAGTQDARMAALIDQAADPALGQTLSSLADRLRARPAKADQLPRDVALENVFHAGRAAFSSSEAPEQAMAQALQALGTLDMASLAAAAASPKSRSADQALAVALAREIAVLPRGIEMLSATLSPDSAAGKIDKETAARRQSSLRVLFMADEALQNAGLSPEARKILLDARSAGAQALERPDARLDDLPPELRKAFNAVRNEFFDDGPGTRLQQADSYLKGLTTDMLSSTSRDNGLMGTLARTLPLGGATALNPSAIQSATKTLAQAGLITATGTAVDAMKAAIADLRGGDTATPAEIALKNMALSLGSAVPPAAPERLLSVTAAHVQVPSRFGLDEASLAQHPPLQQLWESYAGGNLTPAEAAHQLAKVARDGLSAPEEKSARDGVVKFKKAIDKAVGSAIWNRGKIDDKQQLLDGLISIGRLMSLRDKFKFTGGNSYGLDTSRLQLGLKPDGMAEPASLTLRLGLAGRIQEDLVVEVGMTTQAYYLTVGTQSTRAVKLGAGAGVSLKHDAGLVSVGARVADMSISGSYENQWQNGLLARVPRDKTTETRNQQEFEDLLRNAVLWEERGHGGPMEAILANVDAASLNLLGQYNRASRRAEIVGSLGPQLAVSRPVKESSPSSPAPAPAPAPAAPPDTVQVAQARVALQLRSQGEKRSTAAEEASGHYRYQELREAAKTLTQTGVVANASVRLADLGDGKSLSASDAAGASRTADWISGAEVTRRLVTMDGVTAPMRSRRVTEFLDLSLFKQAAEADRARWINHGNTYTKFPKDFEPKQESSEDDFEHFFEDAARLDTQFKQYLVVDCMQVPAAAIVDGYDGSIQLREKLGDHAEATAMQAEREALLADESSWQPRRLVINSVFNTANQPGTVAFGVEMRVTDNSEGAHNDALFPRG